MAGRNVWLIGLLLGVLPAGPARGEPGDPVALTLHPAAAPQPSLKYRLMPDPREHTPGNAATLYYRAEAFFVENLNLLQEVKKDYWSTWLETPLMDLPRDEMRDKLGQCQYLFRELEQATRCNQCDWQLERRKEGLSLLLPDVQGFRMFATLLAVKARYEIAAGNWQACLATLQTGYTLAHHLGHGPSQIHVLVGMAIANVMTRQLQDLVQQPGVPNLYWALAALPHPVGDMQLAIQDQGVMLETMFPEVKLLEKGPASLEQIQAVMLRIRHTLDDLNVRRPDGLETAARAAIITQAHAEAKKALLDDGFAPEQVDPMPVLQVVTVYAFREYRKAWDEAAKWAHVADGFRQPGYRAAANQFRQAVKRLDQYFFRGLLRALSDGEVGMENTHNAIARAERRLAALRCVEALRLHAAAHEGKLPARLADVTEVPVPADPVTGRPFEYQAADGKATLSAPGWPGEKTPPQERLTYELTIRP